MVSDHFQMPKGESLKMVRERITPYWEKEVYKTLKSLTEEGKPGTLLFVAHEHVLRGMVQTLTGIDNQQILSLRIPNAAPFIFEFDENMKPIRNYYLDNKSVPVTDSAKKESNETVLKI
jgi:2,3-bisphosphoglycerate-dependent phosphoglycerate mutase